MNQRLVSNENTTEYLALWLEKGYFSLSDCFVRQYKWADLTNEASPNFINL